MRSYPTARQFIRVTAIAVVLLAIAIAMAVVPSRRGQEADVLGLVEPSAADALVSELARCRTITPDDPGLLESCRHLWAENRQRFFLSTKSPQLPVTSVPDAPTEPVKRQDRVPPHGTEQGGSR
jgi:conjugative transfer region protein TrbK